MNFIKMNQTNGYIYGVKTTLRRGGFAENAARLV